MRAVENGAWNTSLQTRLTELERRQASLTARIASSPAAVPVLLHPNAAEIYKRKVAALEATLTDPAICYEPGHLLRTRRSPCRADRQDHPHPDE